MEKQIELNYKILLKKYEILKNIYEKSKLKNKIVNHEEFSEALCDVLSWIEPTVLNFKFSDNNNRLINAAKFANNKRKHCENLYEITKFTSALYPSNTLYPSENLYPSDFKIYWIKLESDKKEHENKYKCYNDLFLRKDVIETLSNVINIITEKYDKCKS